MYCTAPKGGTGISVRNSTKSVFGRRPDALKTKVSVPRVSETGTTVTVAVASGRQLAIEALAGTSVKLNGPAPSACEVVGLKLNISPKAALAATVAMSLIGLPSYRLWRWFSPGV